MRSGRIWRDGTPVISRILSFVTSEAKAQRRDHLETNRMHGHIYYLTGGNTLFLLLKVLHRCWFGRPFILGGLSMLLGFLWPLLSGVPRAVTEDEARLYRRMLNRRLAERMSRILSLAT